jgi:hypothetical protein
MPDQLLQKSEIKHNAAIYRGVPFLLTGGEHPRFFCPEKNRKPDPEPAKSGDRFCSRKKGFPVPGWFLRIRPPQGSRWNFKDDIYSE